MELVPLNTAPLTAAIAAMAAHDSTPDSPWGDALWIQNSLLEQVADLKLNHQQVHTFLCWGWMCSSAFLACNYRRLQSALRKLLRVSLTANIANRMLLY